MLLDGLLALRQRRTTSDYGRLLSTARRYRRRFISRRRLGRVAVRWRQHASRVRVVVRYAFQRRHERENRVAGRAHVSMMRRTNPAFIPRNHRVEEAIAAARRGDFQPFEVLVEVLGKPYEDQPNHAHLSEPPGAEQQSYKTFCGT